MTVPSDCGRPILTIHLPISVSSLDSLLLWMNDLYPGCVARPSSSGDIEVCRADHSEAGRQ